MADEFIPFGNATEHKLAEAAMLASLAHNNPEGRSIAAFWQEALRPDRA